MWQTDSPSLSTCLSLAPSPLSSLVFSALLVLLQDSLTTTAGSPMFSELVMKVTTFPGFSHLLDEMVYCFVLCFSHSSFLHLSLPLHL